MINIRITKIYDKSIIEPLQITYKQCLEKGCFPNEWKKAMLLLSIENDKQLLKNYQPTSPFLICGKILERVLYNSMFEFFIQNNLITPNQSNFKSGDSCINQLIFITHGIYKSLDDGYKVRGVFLDISKAFDKVWYLDQQYLVPMVPRLNNRTLRVILNGQFSSLAKVEAGVPEASILGSLMFLIYINGLSENLPSNSRLFADDYPPSSMLKNTDASDIYLYNDLIKISEWAFQWKTNFNPDPAKQAQELIFSRKVQMINHSPLCFNQNMVLQISLQKHLGMFLDNKSNFSKHLETIFQKTNKTIRLLRKLQTLLPRALLITIYKSFIRSHLYYGDMIYDQTFSMSFQKQK